MTVKSEFLFAGAYLKLGTRQNIGVFTFSNHKVLDVSFPWKKTINFEAKVVSRREIEN